MAPIKLEDHFKERLEEREISPSASSWDQLNARLDMQNQQKRSRKRLWFAIAASFIGGLFIASIFIKQPSKEIPVIEVVETPAANQQSTTQEKTVITTPENIQDPVVEKKRTVVQKKITPPIKKESAVVAKDENLLKRTPVQNNDVTAIAEQQSDKVIDIKENKTLDIETQIAEKVDELITKVATLETQNTAVTDAEIDALLAQAQREIISNNIFDQKTNKVDANALLLDIEAELYPESFRARVFETLKESFIKTRDALANRNN